MTVYPVDRNINKSFGRQTEKLEINSYIIMIDQQIKFLLASQNMDVIEKNKKKPRLRFLLCTVVSGTLMIVSGYTLGFKILPEFVKNQIWEVRKMFSSQEFCICHCIRRVFLLKTTQNNGKYLKKFHFHLLSKFTCLILQIIKKYYKVQNRYVRKLVLTSISIYFKGNKAIQ